MGNDSESRRNWMLHIFAKEGQKNSRNRQYQFWRQDNQPKELFSNRFMEEKLQYLHNNPVVGGWVDKPADYRYSSARDYEGLSGLIEVSFL